ncbi:MAG TPA: DnaA regulatory inactivator Hda [Thiotrichales bacterium]|nr:DnaA regulatory inactivator Hda [Thiotrichales bacterium]
MSSPSQLPLDIARTPRPSLEDFVPGENGALLATLREWARGTESRLLYLWGVPGSGKSHLLQGACTEAGRGGRAALVALPLLLGHGPGVLEGLAGSGFLVVDGLQAIAGRSDWEGALFRLFNATRDRGGSMLFAARGRPAELGLGLPDLVSRLQWAEPWQVRPLDDAGRLQVLRQQATARGLELSEEVGRFLLHRHSRDLRHLSLLLERLDLASLAERRRLTVPFVRSVLAAEGRDRFSGRGC